MEEKRIPSAIEAEQGVLGSIMIDPEAIVFVADFLFPDDFQQSAHTTLYAVIQRLYENREPADLITVCDELERTGKMSAMKGKIRDAYTDQEQWYEGMSYVMALTNAVPTSAHAEFYGRIVARAANCRRYITVAKQLADMAYNQDDGITEKAEKLFYDASMRTTPSTGFLSMQDVMTDYMRELDTLQNKPGTLTGVTTGYHDLNKLLGGLQKTDLIILAGRPGSGKTSLGTNIAYNAALEDKHVAVFSLEMGNRQLARRLTSMVSGIDMQRLRKGWIEDDEWTPITASVGALSNLPIWMNDTAANPITSIRSQLRRLIQSAGGIDLVIVDYLQLIGEEDSEHQRRNREQEIAEVSRGLKAIAKEFDVPVLALAQLSRKVEERQKKVPILSDLRESGSIENDADIVMFIYRDDYYAEQEQRESTRPGIADVYIAKHRNGPCGMIPLHFKAELTRFYNIQEGQAE